jgi:formylglycine-generating enzyme required for sulfatase activity
MSQVDAALASRRWHCDRLVQLLTGQNTDGYPVESVSWERAASFYRRLSALSEERAPGRRYQLPTEAE